MDRGMGMGMLCFVLLKTLWPDSYLVPSRVYPPSGGILSPSFVPYLVLCCPHIKCLGCLAK